MLFFTVAKSNQIMSCPIAIKLLPIASRPDEVALLMSHNEHIHCIEQHTLNLREQDQLNCLMKRKKIWE